MLLASIFLLCIELFQTEAPAYAGSITGANSGGDVWIEGMVPNQADKPFPLSIAIGEFKRVPLAIGGAVAANLINVTVKTTKLLRQHKSGLERAIYPPTVRVFQQGYLYKHYHMKQRAHSAPVIPTDHIHLSPSSKTKPCPFARSMTRISNTKDSDTGAAVAGYLPHAVLEIPSSGISFIGAGSSQKFLVELSAAAAATVPGIYSANLSFSGTVQSTDGGVGGRTRPAHSFVRILPFDIHVRPRVFVENSSTAPAVTTSEGRFRVGPIVRSSNVASTMIMGSLAASDVQQQVPTHDNGDFLSIAFRFGFSLSIFVNFYDAALARVFGIKQHASGTILLGSYWKSLSLVSVTGVRGC
eukprot:SAG31_NODE_330_length_17593_cov_4.817891_23_plen_356_part_00